MKKFKNLVAIILVVSLIFIFTVPYSAQTLSENNPNEYKIDTKLQEVIESTSDDELIEVALWLSDVDENERQEQISAKIRSTEKDGELISTFAIETDLSTIGTSKLSNEEFSEQAQTLVELKRDVEKELHTANNADVLTALDSSYDIDEEPLFVSDYAPLVIMEMTKDNIYSIINSTSIERVYYYEELDITEESEMFENEIAVANEVETTEQHPYGVWQDITNIKTLKEIFNLSGSGVKIGLLGNSVPNFDYEGISPTDSERLHQQFAYHLNNNLLHCAENVYFSTGAANHADYMLSIISGFAGDYEGVAHLAEIYCDGYRYGWEYFHGVENLVDAGVNVISSSIHWGGSSYDYVSKYVDYVISNSEITFCASAGNNPNANNIGWVLSAAAAYNAIAVGNIDDNNSLDSSNHNRSSQSLYYNSPNSVYKPDICAPGQRASTYVAQNITSGGTSAACPIVAGSCALLMEAFPELKTKPVLMKSLLMASATELFKMTDIYSTATSIEPALTRECGPGMIDVYKAYETYINGNSRFFYSHVSSYNYAIEVNQEEADSEKDIYISLNWLQWNTENGDDWNLESNYNVLNGNHHTLSLYDPDGQLVAVSDYHYDRKQFIRYQPSKTGRYTAKITRSHTGVLQYYPQFAVAHCIK